MCVQNCTIFALLKNQSNNLKPKAMTQIESIQMNIHEVRTKLAKTRSIITNDPIELMFKDSSIEFYLKELNDLRFSLKCAIVNQSK